MNQDSDTPQPAQPRISRGARSTFAFWAAYACAWLALGLWLGINVIIGHRNGGSAIAAWEPLTWELSSVVVIGILAVFVYHFERRFPLSGADWPQRLPVHAVAALAFSTAHVVAMVGLRKIIYVAHGQTYDFGDPRLGFAACAAPAPRARVGDGPA